MLFIGTGKRRAVARALAYFKKIEQEKKITILAVKQLPKSVLLFKYEELRILYNSDKLDLEIERKILSNLDFARVRREESVAVRLSTPWREDDWLKGSVLEVMGGFQMRGGKVQFTREDKDTKSRRHKRQYEMLLTGPSSLITSYTSTLISKNLADPKSLEYVL